MAYGVLRRGNTRWNNRGGQARMVIAYLVGTLGMGIVIVIGLILSNAGWLDGVQTRLRHAESNLPNVLQGRATEATDMIDSVIGKAVNLEESTTTLLQHASESSRQLTQRSQPPASGRRE